MTMHIETANAESLLENPAGAHPWSRREEMKRARLLPFSALKQKSPFGPEMNALMQEASSFHS